MSRGLALRVLGGLALLALASMPLTHPTIGHSAGSAVPADFIADPIAYYLAARPREALAYATPVLADPAVAPGTRRTVLVTVASIHLAQGNLPKARTAIRRILDADPTATLEQSERLPPPVRRLFYQMRDSVCWASREALVSKGALVADLRTIAVGDIENNSLVHGAYDADHLCKGLVHVLVSDLQRATPLRVVERQRLEVLQAEIGLDRQGALAPDTRVRFGQLLGAQSFLFGQFMQVDRWKVRLDLRWVNTATGEVMLAEGAEGSARTASDLFALERKVLVDLLAPRIQKLLDGSDVREGMQQQLRDYLEHKQRTLASRDAYPRMVVAAGEAIAFEDAGRYGDAGDAWSRAAKLDPGDKSLAQRAQSLAAYQRLRRTP